MVTALQCSVSLVRQIHGRLAFQDVERAQRSDSRIRKGYQVKDAEFIEVMSADLLLQSVRVT